MGGGRPMSCAGLRASQGFGYTTYMHTGIDLVCGPGTPVVSIASGTFERRQDSSQRPCPASLGGSLHGGFGLYGVVTNRTGVQLIYGHLEGFALPDGSPVSPGDVLGFEGATGCATGFHLHFEVRVGGKPVNPCSFLASDYPATHEVATHRCWGAVLP
jgi:murein DD-endopeptidase MepM/ murein hydrolase activator NlpD